MICTVASNSDVIVHGAVEILPVSESLPAVERLPEKRFSNLFDIPGIGRVEQVSEWWPSNEPEAKEGFPDLDIETGDTTGFDIINYLIVGGQTFYPVSAE